MSLIGMKLADVVPPSARVIRRYTTELTDPNGKPTGMTLVEEHLDVNGDEFEEFKRDFVQDRQGNVQNTWYSVLTGNPIKGYDLFADGNGDGVLDQQVQLAVASTPDGMTWTYEAYSIVDRNFDGRADRRVRFAGPGGKLQWVLEDVDFDGDYDVETRWTRLPTRDDPKGSKTTRDVNIDVSVLE